MSQAGCNGVLGWYLSDDFLEGESFEDDSPAYLLGYCTCGWCGSDTYWKGDGDSEKKARQRMCNDHEAKHPKCLDIPNIDIG